MYIIVTALLTNYKKTKMIKKDSKYHAEENIIRTNKVIFS